MSACFVNGTLPSGEGGNDTHSTLHELEARPAGWDGKPVPYEGVRSCAIVSTEFVGEAFRLPGRHGRRQMRAGCYAGRYFPDPLGSLRCAGRGKRDGKPVPYGPQGGRPIRAWCGGNRFCPDPLGSLRCADRCKRDGRPVPYEGVRSCAIVSIEFVGEAFRLPLGVRTSQMERHRAAKAVTTRKVRMWSFLP